MVPFPTVIGAVTAHALYGITRKFTLLVSVPLGVVTWTMPVMAPRGTVVVISVLETTLKTAAAPLNVTLVVPFNLFPKIMTLVPAVPDIGAVSTQGPDLRTS